jgi:hypothetical protein
MKEHRLALGDLAAGLKFPVDEVHKITLLKASRFRLVGMFFDTSKCFLLPVAIPGIRRIAELYGEHPGAELLVVGHTDTSGKIDYNQTLSLERAEALIAYLTDDVDAWVAHFEAKDDAKRWGTREIQLMLRKLPEKDIPFYLGEAHGKPDEATDKAIRAFQQANGLKVDGIAGPNTREALIQGYMSLDGTTLPDGIKATAHGCGESFPAVETKDGAKSPQDRRAEIFFFDDGIEPAPPGKTSAKGSKEYPQWVASVAETIDLVFASLPDGPLDFDLPKQKQLVFEPAPDPGPQGPDEPFLVAANDDALVVKLVEEARQQNANRGKDGTSSSAEGDFIPFRMVDKAKRPEIRLDHGFLDDGKGNLDKSKMRKDTFSDRLSYLKWHTKLEAAEILRPDLFEATQAYRRFMDASGRAFEFDYEEFVLTDRGGKRTVDSSVEDAIAAAIELSDTQKKPDFIMQTDAIGVGSKNPRFPYPGTENWQKAIGAHVNWLEARVQVEIKDDKRLFKIDLILRSEDRYNFNPDAKDIATGIADAENGVFELTGLGKEFDRTSILKRRIEFSASKDPVPDLRKPPGDRRVTTPR